MMYYNFRLTKTRNESVITERYLADKGIAFSAAGRPLEKAKWYYDREELIVFSLVLVMSLVPRCVVWIFSPW
jgi:hypothetical protein